MTAGAKIFVAHDNHDKVILQVTLPTNLEFSALLWVTFLTNSYISILGIEGARI